MATVTELAQKIEVLEATNAKLVADVKKLQKAFKKLAKENEDPDKPKRASGFAKPMKLSEALTQFLGVDSDTMMARTDVTKEINKYVKAHNLQNPENKREIILDAKLRTIIKQNGDESITFFNLQRYMSPHYIKDDRPESAPVEEEAPKEEKKPVKKIVKKVIKVAKA